jgi:predicted ribosomally synthesized peptide with nif11-like leader
MSAQAAKDFLKKLQSDPSLKAKFQKAPDQATRHRMAKEAGFDFTLPEFKQAVDEVTAAAGEGELTEEQLKDVAGGFCFTHIFSSATNDVGSEASQGLHEVGQGYNEAGNEAGKA